MLGHENKLDVLQLYWVCRRHTSSEYVAKALLAWCRLSGEGDDSALIVMYASKEASGDGAHAVLRSFASEMSPSIDQALASTQKN